VLCVDEKPQIQLAQRGAGSIPARAAVRRQRRGATARPTCSPPWTSRPALSSAAASAGTGASSSALSQALAQLADVDVDPRILARGQALPILVSAKRWCRDDLAPLRGQAESKGMASQAAQDVIQGQQRAAAGPPPLRPRSGRRCMAGMIHPLIDGRGSMAPLGDGPGVLPVPGGQSAGRFLRCLELNRDARRRTGSSHEDLLPSCGLLGR
jgi:hypothetical protein